MAPAIPEGYPGEQKLPKQKSGKIHPMKPVTALMGTLLLASLSACGPGICTGMGECLEAGARAELNANLALDFGTRAFGQTTENLLLIENLGKVPATDLNAEISGTAFSFAGGSFPGTGGTCSDSLGAGASCVLGLRFTSPSPPADQFAETLTATYFDGSDARTLTVNLVGETDNGIFTRDVGFDLHVNSFVKTSRGFVLGGGFATYNSGSVNRIARVSETGVLDTTFAVGTGFNGDVNTIVEAPDGSGDLYVGGQFTSYQGTAANRIIRLNSDGSVDPTFAYGTGFDGNVNSMALDASGDVYVGGAFTTYQGAGASRIVRLNSDGSADGAFVVGAGFDAAVQVLTYDSISGGIYAGGDFTTYKAVGAARIIRIQSNGTTDAAFNVGSGFDGQVRAITPAADATGDIYVGGGFSNYQGAGQVRLARLNSNGTVDGAFVVGTGFDQSAVSIANATDGSGDIYVGGNYVVYRGTSAPKILRINSDGSFDTGFAAGTGFRHQVNAILPLADGSGDLYAGGVFLDYGSQGVNRWCRLNADGSLDGSLPVNGGLDSTVWSLTADPSGDGSIWVGGDFSRLNGVVAPRMLRRKSSGELDTSISMGTGANSTVYAIKSAGTSSWGLYFGGDFTSFNGTPINRGARLLSTGALDPSFAVGTGFDVTVRAILPLADGSGTAYFAGDFLNYNSAAHSRIVRVLANGTVDAGFNAGTGFGSTVYTLAFSPDGSGKIYVGGNFTTYNGAGAVRVALIGSNGTRDVTFNPGASANGAVRKIVPVGDGSGDLYLGGDFSTYDGSSYNGLVRINALGSVDTTLSIGTGFAGVVRDIVETIDGTGDIYVAGNYTSYNGGNANFIVRLTRTGAPAANYVNYGGFGNTVNVLLVAPDLGADIYAGGFFSIFNRSIAQYMARVSPEGNLE